MLVIVLKIVKIYNNIIIIYIIMNLNLPVALRLSNGGEDFVKIVNRIEDGDIENNTEHIIMTKKIF